MRRGINERERVGQPTWRRGANLRVALYDSDPSGEREKEPPAHGESVSARSGLFLIRASSRLL